MAKKNYPNIDAAEDRLWGMGKRLLSSDPLEKDLRTPADVEAYVARVIEQLEASGIRDLARVLQSLERERSDFGPARNRLPLPFVQEVPDLQVTAIEMRPWIDCTLEHFVVTPATAAAFELVDMKIGKCSLMMSGAKSIPLEFFSLAYLGNERLSAIQQWKTDRCQVGMTITAFVQRIEDRSTAGLEPARAFEGLAWCRCFY